jgi:hypothetical protein
MNLMSLTGSEFRKGIEWNGIEFGGNGWDEVDIA